MKQSKFWVRLVCIILAGLMTLSVGTYLIYMILGMI